MLDTTTAIAAATPWTETLQRGDVVLFEFPCADDGPVKTRPCLVLEVGRLGDNAFAEIAYGTSAMSKANRGYEIQINTATGMAQAGISQATRFVGVRRVTVTLDSKLFRMPRGSKSPIIGRLDDAGLERMNALRDRIWADRERAAEWRAGRRGFTEKGVPVVRRHGTSSLSAFSKGAA